MAHLYVTTDSFEAETLIEDTEVGQKKEHIYRDLEFSESKSIESRIGFNPMCSVHITNGDSSPKGLDRIATSLVKLGLFVATESEGNIQRYIPADMENRNLMLKLAMEKATGDFRFYDSQASGFVLFYSNDACAIRSEVPFRF